MKIVRVRCSLITRFTTFSYLEKKTKTSEIIHHVSFIKHENVTARAFINVVLSKHWIIGTVRVISASPFETVSKLRDTTAHPVSVIAAADENWRVCVIRPTLSLYLINRILFSDLVFLRRDSNENQPRSRT